MSTRPSSAAILLKVDDSGETGARYLVMTAGAERPQIWTEPDAHERSVPEAGKAEILLMTAASIAGEKRAFFASTLTIVIILLDSWLAARYTCWRSGHGRASAGGYEITRVSGRRGMI